MLGGDSMEKKKLNKCHSCTWASWPDDKHVMCVMITCVKEVSKDEALGRKVLSKQSVA